LLAAAREQMALLSQPLPSVAQLVDQLLAQIGSLRQAFD